MAARLAKATGFDPLTVDQTDQTERGTRESSSSVLKRLAPDDAGLARPAVFEAPGGEFRITGDWAGKVDVQILHPPAQLVEGRPDWLQMGGYRQLVPVPDSIQPGPARVLVQASSPAGAMKPFRGTRSSSHPVSPARRWPCPAVITGSSGD